MVGMSTERLTLVTGFFCCSRDRYISVALAMLALAKSPLNSTYICTSEEIIRKTAHNNGSYLDTVPFELWQNSGVEVKVQS